MRTRNRVIGLIAVMALLLAAFLARPLSAWLAERNRLDAMARREGARYMMEAFGGSAATWAVVAHPDQVLLYGVDYPNDSGNFSEATLLGPVKLPASLARDIATEFSTPENHYFEALPACDTTRAGILEFRSGHHVVRVAASVYCPYFDVYTGDRGPSLDAKTRSGGGYLQSHGLLKALDRYFPENDDLQRYKEEDPAIGWIPWRFL